MSRYVLERYCLAWAILFFLPWAEVQAQSPEADYTFVVVDAGTDEPIFSATCRVYDAENTLRTYGISDAEGRLHVACTDADVLVFSRMGYGRQRLTAKDFSTTAPNRVRLVEEAVEIREVAVKVPPIRLKSDTIVYNVGSFVGAEDSHLEDVLKKMPGIKVADNGAISYQGKAISHFYIEGKDLLGNSYNQATRNMPVEAVAAVEVLENHQPSKMLRGRQQSDKAALNIRLDKDHKSVPFGEVEGGVGLSFPLWKAGVFLTQIFDNNQMLVTAKANNVGIDLSAETKEHIDMQDVDSYEPLTASVLDVYDMSENIPLERYVRNKSLSAGVNELTGLGSDATLRANVLLFRDHSHYNSADDYLFGGEPAVSICERTFYDKKQSTVIPLLRFEKNGDCVYLSDEFKYSLSKISVPNQYVTNGDALREDVKYNLSYFNNYFTSALPVGEQIVQFKSLLRYSAQDEELGVAGGDCDAASQQSKINSLTAKNMLTSSVDLWGNTLRYGASVYYRRNAYECDGTEKYSKIHCRLLPAYEVAYGAGSFFSVEMPVGWLRARLADGDERAIVSFSPSLFLRHKINHDWKFIFSASWGVDDDAQTFYARQPVMTNYRTTFTACDKILIDRTMMLVGRLNYANLATMFFANFTASFSHNRNGGYTHFDYTDTLSNIITVEGKNHHKSLMLNASADKSFAESGLALKMSLNYNRSRYPLSQSTLALDNVSNIASGDVDVSFRGLQWLKTMVGMRGVLFWQQNDVSDADPLRSANVKASVYLIGRGGSKVQLSFVDYATELTHNHFKHCAMLDASASARLGKDFDILLSLSNLLDSEKYRISSDSGIDSRRSDLPLRGREALITLKYRISP